MQFKVIDINFARSKELKEYLSCSDNIAVICDEFIAECFKSDQWHSTLTCNLNFIDNHIGQVAFINPVSDLMLLSIRNSTFEFSPEILMSEEMTNSIINIYKLPESEFYTDQINADRKNILTSKLDGGKVEFAGSLYLELKSSLMKKQDTKDVVWLYKYFTACLNADTLYIYNKLILENLIYDVAELKPWRTHILSVQHMVLMTKHWMWYRDNGYENLKEIDKVNDITDVDYIFYGLMCNGILTREKKSNEAYAIVKKWLDLKYLSS